MDRTGFIGGSDCPDLLNVDWGCRRRLYYEKSGRIPDRPFFGNNATRRGTKLEPFVAAEYAEHTGRIVRKAPWRQHPHYPMFGCHSDYEIIEHADGAAPLSIKVPGREAFFAMKDMDSPPIGYIAQVQWEMFIWNRQWGAFAIFWADGWRLKAWDIKRDETIIAGLVEAAQEFWENLEARDESAFPILPVTDKRCKGCGYAATCHKAEYAKLLEAERDSTLPTDPSLAVLAAEVKEREALADEATELVEEAKERLKAALGDRQAVDTDGYRVYYRVQQGRESFQAAAFKKDHPELRDEVAKYTSKGKPFRTLRIFDKG